MLSYVVCENSCSDGAASSPVDILLDMQPGHAQAYVEFKNRIQIAMRNISVSDADDGEVQGALMNVTVSLESEEASSTVDVSAEEVGDGVHFFHRNVQEAQFEGSLDAVNKAMNAVTVSMPGDYEGFSNVSITVDDRGNGDTNGEPLIASAVAKFSISLDQVPRIVSIAPNEAPLNGGSFVRIEGSGFEDSNVCVFTMDGVQINSARTIRFSPTHIVCEIPPYPVAGCGSVHVANEKFESELVQFWYREGLSLDSAKPEVGPVQGGTSVLISGGPFMPYDTLFCDFDGTHVPGEFVSSAGIVCISPPRTTGASNAISVHVSTNGEHFPQREFNLHIQTRTLRIPSSPAYGPSLGGTTIHVFGQNFRRDSALECTFWRCAVRCLFVSEREVLCATPPLDVNTTQQVPLEITYAYDSFASRGNAASLAFTYVKGPVFEVVTPLSGYADADTPVTIAASPLPVTSTWTCRFGNVVVAGIILDDVTLECNASSSIVGVVPVDVSYNDVDYIRHFRVLNFMPT